MPRGLSAFARAISSFQNVLPPSMMVSPVAINAPTSPTAFAVGSPAGTISQTTRQACRHWELRRPRQARRFGARDRGADHPDGAHPPAAGTAARFLARHLDHPLGADLDDGAVHPHAARILLVPDRSAHFHHAAPRA